MRFKEAYYEIKTKIKATNAKLKISLLSTPSGQLSLLCPLNGFTKITKQDEIKEQEKKTKKA